MVFSSSVFLLAFLPAVLVFYFLIPAKYTSGRNAVLLAASLIFYGWGEPKYILLMLLSILFNYLLALTIENRRIREKRYSIKIILLICVAGNLSILGFFKYTDFLLHTISQISGSNLGLLNIALPVGISFYTFQTMSYVIDVYRGTVKAQRNLLAFALYVSLFPQLIAGPIVRYRDVEPALSCRADDTDRIAEGIRRFIIGFAKKVLLANQIFVLWNEISRMDTISASAAWLGALAFTMQIYFDFSGYSDMAIGLGKIFGFDYQENFNYPYTACSITDFWRRWHISLSSWFKEYVYVPLGGNRKGLPRQIFNIAVVWALTGLWHGAGWNFILWGVYFAVILICEKLFLLKMTEKLPHVFRHLYAMVFIIAGWVIFAIDDMTKMAHYFSMMFGASGSFIDDTFLYFVETRALLLIVCILCATPFPARLFKAAEKRLKNHQTIRWSLEIPLFLAGFLLTAAFLVSGSYNPFLYFRF